MHSCKNNIRKCIFIINYIIIYLFAFLSISILDVCKAYAKDDLYYPEAPDVITDNCILMDADTGNILYEKNSKEQCYPASVTKLMTALLVTENCNMSDTLTVSSNAVASVKYGDANAALKKDEEFTVEQALNVMLIKSANDMAYALGEYVGGSMANFANMMNKKAEELGCLNTHFSNASGLTDVNHYTTAYDMALICRAVINVPAIMNAISYTKSYSVPPTNMTSDTRYYKLSHSMVTGKYLYEYCIGGKTGYTDAAGHTLATFAEKDGLRLICIIFNSTDEERYQDTTALFDYAFNNFHRVNISENEDSFSFNQGLGLSVFGISGKALKVNTEISLSVPSEDYLLIPNGVPFSGLTREIIYTDNSETEGTDADGTGDTFHTSLGYASINYYYDNHFAGQTSLIIPSTYDNALSTGLPYIVDTGLDSTSTIYSLQGVHYVGINIWLFIVAICIIILIIVFILHSRKNRHRLRFG